MPIWHQSPKLTPRYFLETPRLFGYPFFLLVSKILTFRELNVSLFKAHSVIFASYTRA